MEECWDHDAEARLSASCVLERVTAQQPAAISASLTPDTTPLLIHELAEQQLCWRPYNEYVELPLIELWTVRTI